MKSWIVFAMWCSGVALADQIPENLFHFKDVCLVGVTTDLNGQEDSALEQNLKSVMDLQLKTARVPFAADVLKCTDQNVVLYQSVFTFFDEETQSQAFTTRLDAYINALSGMKFLSVWSSDVIYGTYSSMDVLKKDMPNVTADLISSFITDWKIAHPVKK